MSEIVVYGKQEMEEPGPLTDTKTVTISLLTDLGVAHAFVDVEASAADAARAAEIGGSTRVPVVVLPDGAALVEPSDDEVRAHL